MNFFPVMSYEEIIILVLLIISLSLLSKLGFYSLVLNRNVETVG